MKYPWESNSLKNGRYQLGEESRVDCEICYEAQDTMTNQKVQVRKLDPDMVHRRGVDLARAKDIYFWYAEKWGRAALECPDTMASVLDRFEERGTGYLVIKQPGDFLSWHYDVPVNIGMLMDADAVMQVGSRALEALHRQGLLVLRFDGRNDIMGEWEGKPRLAFFFAPEQLSRPVISQRDAWMSSHYAAPEVYLGKPLGPAADVYAFSALVYATAVTIPDKSLFRLYGNLGLPNPQDKWRIKREFPALVRGLSLDPKDRQQSIRQLRDEYFAQKE